MSAAMKVQVEAQPLHEPLAGGTPGATVVVEPLIAGHVDFPQAMMVSPGGRFLTLKLLRALFAAKPAERDPGPGLPDPPPQRRRDPRRHRPAPLDRHRRQGELRRPRQPHRQADAGGRRRRAGAAAQARPRPGRDPGRGDDPPAQRPHLGDLGVPELDLRRQRRPSGRRRRPARGRSSTATAAPHFDYAFDYRTVDFDRAGIDSYASFGRTFDLFADGSIHLAFTPGHSAGHMSVICRLEQDDFVIGGDAMYMAAQLERRRADAAAALRRPQLPPLAAGAAALPLASSPAP